jgi:methionine-rich copper-binding protein CopC
MKKKFIVRWSLILALSLPFLASAHAFLDHADPKVGSTIGKSPDVLKLWFTQKVEPAFSSVKVTDSTGREVDKKDCHVDELDQSILLVSVPLLPAGTYTVSWHVISVDTHKTQGHFEFTIR